MSSGITNTQTSNLNKILAATKNNIALEKQINTTKAPRPEVVENSASKTQTKNYSQALLLAASAGILIMQGIILLKKPHEIKPETDEKLAQQLNNLSNQVKEILEKIGKFSDTEQKTVDEINASVNKSIENLSENIEKLFNQNTSSNADEFKKSQQTIIESLNKAIAEIKQALKENKSAASEEMGKAKEGAIEKLQALEEKLNELGSKLDSVDETIEKFYDEFDEAQTIITRKNDIFQLKDVNFKDGVAYNSQTKKKFDGILEYTNNNNERFEITYNDGTLIKSEKFGDDGDVVLRKFYSQEQINKGGKIYEKKVTKIFDESPISKVIISTKDAGKKENKINSLTINTRNEEAKTMKEQVRFAQNEDGSGYLFDTKGDKLRFIETKDRKKIQTMDLPLDYVSKPSTSGDGFQFLAIKEPKIQNNNPTKD